MVRYVEVCSSVLRKAAFALCILGLALVASAQEARIITFDVPGAGTDAGQGTFAIAIIQSGAITGYYVDANNVSHGFLRTPSGKFTTFDPAGSQSTIVHTLNVRGAIVGAYLDANLEFNAFLRSPDGTFTTFEAPGACTGGLNVGCHGSGAWDINLFGTSVGPYEDTSGNFVAHSFIRTPDGTITTFEVPGSSMLVGQGTLPASPFGFNQSGAITGVYYDANYVFHGYLRGSDGTFTTFEAPGADTTTFLAGTQTAGLNDFGAITGFYLDATSVFHGFLRSPDGTFTTFQSPGADTNPGDFNGTFPSNINLVGAITGSYIDASNVNHGFVRTPDGKFTTFDAPGAGTGFFQGTIPVSNNTGGAITGFSIDGANVAHGFVRKP